MALVNFNKPGQRLPAAAVGPAYQAGMTNINEFAPDQDMVNALLQRGASTAPVQSNKEGMYRALQGVLGGYMKGRDKRDLQSQRDAYGEAVMGAVAKGQGTAGTPGTPGTPEKFEVLSTPVDPRISSAEPRPAALGSILDDPSVPDVAALGLRRVGDQVVEQEAAPAVDAVAEVKGTPGGLQPMLDALRGDGTRDPRLQSALNETALMMQYGGLQDKAAQDAAELAYQRQLGLVKPTKPSSQIQGWERAKEDGYGGSLVDWVQLSTEKHFNPNAMNEKFADERYEAANDSLIDAEKTLFDVSQMMRLVEQVDSGTLASTKNKILKIMEGVGMNVDLSGIAKFEDMQSQGMGFILQRIKLTKGAISEKEMEAFEAASPGVKNTPEGNKRILTLARLVANRQKAVAQAVRAISSRKGVTKLEIDNERIRAMEEFGEISVAPVGIDQQDWEEMTVDERGIFNNAGAS
jgi:hypothetical protein